MGLLWDDQAERRVLIFGLRCGKRKTDPFGVAAGKKVLLCFDMGRIAFLPHS
jgi:hypothetical protein